MNRFRSVLMIGVVIASSILALGQNKAESKWAKYDNGRVHYYDTGGKNKKALVLIHGWTCNADFWTASMGAFPGYRVIAIDLPGHGQSDKPKTNYSMEYFAKSIDAVLKAAKVTQAVLVGHSMGTPVIRQFYRIYPQETLGLVIVDGPVKPYAPRNQMETFLTPLRTNYKENATKMIDGMVTPVKTDSLKKTIRDGMLATPDYVGISAMYGMIDDAIWTDDQIKVPVLAILNGDRPWPPNTKDTFTSVAPNLEFQSWTGVSHFLMMEKPKEFNDAVRNFITKNKLL